MTGQGKQAYRDVVTPAYTSETDTYVFQYSPPEHRRVVSEARHQNYKGPPMKILLLGKPCSGKGTIAPMLSRAYRAVVVSTGNLLRAEVKAESVLGAIAEEQMAKGKLLPSRLLLSLIQARLTHRDCGANGWILDGFPRSPEQARLLAEAELVPDCIVVLERPDELVREFALGRMQDSATGTIYHPKFNPPPPDAVHRLVWRTDDTPEVIESRLRQHHATMQRTLAEFKGVPTAQIDSARSDLDTFADVCDFVEAVAARKLEALGEEGLRRVSTEVDSRLKDVEVAPEEGEGPDAGTLVAAVRRCNRHDIRHYLPVYMGDSQERTRTLEGLVQSLVSAGVIDGTSVRDELQTPLARMERAAMIHFGVTLLQVPSHGVHVNGYTAIKVNGGDWWRPHKVWLGVRSMSKATYPGLLDQLAAGGLSSGVSLKENVVRECMEEASVPLSFSKNILPAGQVSYRYSTRKGLSTKILTVFDLQLPEDFVPFNGDGEVEEFRLVPIKEALDSIRQPNCALVMIDFALRHGFVKADDADYLELCHSLRAGHVPQ
ncbi:adenylate kinase family protein [Tribonema minus]|uniref:Adenylate kinase family protein n=1 Tax=Tribonema minus TaxID=303371 RepID=A0A836CMM1_9STRA|nr:adenylate kinase family protein [Tribonema minus]